MRWITLNDVTDERGHLTAIEAYRDVPFEIMRVFMVHHVTDVDRGGHAHRDTEQVALAAHGCLSIEVSDGVRSSTFELRDPARGLYLPPLTWIRLFNFSDGAVLMVLASTHYDDSRTINSWSEFVTIAGNR